MSMKMTVIFVNEDGTPTPKFKASIVLAYSEETVCLDFILKVNISHSFFKKSRCFDSSVHKGRISTAQLVVGVGGGGGGGGRIRRIPSLQASSR